MLTKRAGKILELLLSRTDDLLTIKRLGKKFEFSERNIRNDLYLIDDFLLFNDLDSIQKN